MMGKKSYVQRFGKQLAERDGWTCHYCQKSLVPNNVGKENPLYRHIFGYEILENGEKIPLWETKPEYGDATVDHIVLRKNGGTNDLDNMVLACWECNTERNIKPYKEFRELIELRIGRLS